MSDHDFEKRVQHKLDELKFTPSDAVWSKVESNLRREKPRRRGWLWIPVLAGLLATGGYYLVIGDKSPADASHGIADNKQTSTEANSNQNSQVPNQNNSQSGDNKRRDDGAAIPEANDFNESKAASNEFEPNSTTDLNPDKHSAKNADLKDLHADSPAGNNAESNNPKTFRAGSQNPESNDKSNKPGHSQTNEKLNNAVDPASHDKSDKPGQNNAVLNNKAPRDIAGAPNRQKNRSDFKSAKQDSNTIIGIETGRSVNDVPLRAQQGADVAAKRADQIKIDQPGRRADDEKGDNKAFEIRQDSVTSAMNISGKPDTSSDVEAAGIQQSSAVAASKNDKLATDSLSSAPIQLKGISKIKKWQFGITMTGGISSISEGPLGDFLKSASVADVAERDVPGSNNFISFPIAAGVPPPVPSTVKPGFAFSIGGYAGRQLTKRISFTVGLGYMQYNNLIQVGYRVDSSMLVNNVDQVANVSRYYRADQKSKFNNRYHFVEVPLQFQTRINKALKTPLSWNAGIAVARMFASRALLFDSGTGVYYEDNNRYNRTQFALNTGLSIGVLSRSKLPLTIGPSIKYHLTPLYKDNIGGRKHLLSASLDLRLQLYKK